MLTVPGMAFSRALKNIEIPEGWSSLCKVKTMMLEHPFTHSDRKTVLFIDDDEDIVDRLTEVFKLEDYEVLTASNGKEALNLLHHLPDSELPDFIMLDYMMPVMNGEEFSEERNRDERMKYIPVVLMTANGDIESLKEKLHVNAYVEKPMNIEHVLNLAHFFVH